MGVCFKAEPFCPLYMLAYSWFNSYALELVPIFYYRDKTRVQMFYFLINMYKKVYTWDILTYTVKFWFRLLLCVIPSQADSDIPNHLVFHVSRYFQKGCAL